MAALTVANSGLSLKGWGALNATQPEGGRKQVSSTVLLALSSILFPGTAGVYGQGWQDRLTSPPVTQMCPSHSPQNSLVAPSTHKLLPVNHGTPGSSSKPPPATRCSMAPCCKPYTPFSMAFFEKLPISTPSVLNPRLTSAALQLTSQAYEPVTAFLSASSVSLPVT